MNLKRFCGFALSLIMVFSSINIGFAETTGDTVESVDTVDVVDSVDVVDAVDAVDAANDDEQKIELLDKSDTDVTYDVEGLIKVQVQSLIAITMLQTL